MCSVAYALIPTLRESLDEALSEESAIDYPHGWIYEIEIGIHGKLCLIGAP
jgi:hypothetical protein